MDLIIIDHYAKTVFSNLSRNRADRERLALELTMKGGLGSEYIKMPLTASIAIEMADTTSFVTRRGNTYIVETIGDLDTLTTE